MSLSIRARLTLWYTAVLSLILILSAAALYLVHSRSRMTLLDEELARAAAMVARILPPELEEGLELAQAAPDALEDIEMPGRLVAVFDGAGARLAGRWGVLPGVGVSDLGEEGGATTVRTPAGSFRVYRARHRYKNTSYQVAVAESLATVDRELVGLRNTLLGGVLFALLLAGGGGIGIARGALRPVALMAVQAQSISDRTPGSRLTPANPLDELGLLARSFNDLLSRLETVISLQRQFMADASHELRTPVSIARTAIEVTLGRHGRTEEEYRDSLGVVREQMRRLSHIVEDLFTLARADAAGLPLDRRPVYLDELVADCLRETKLLAAPRGVSLAWHGPSDLEISADEQLLRQMLVNLLANAIRHTPSGGWVRVDLVERGDAVEVEVADSGEGIPESERERIFERFVRLDSSGGHDGSGLGLPIARAIVEAHGGSLSLARSDASGSTFLARLPRPKPEARPTVILRSSGPA